LLVDAIPGDSAEDIFERDQLILALERVFGWLADGIYT
jgi:hypothetical protein